VSDPSITDLSLIIITGHGDVSLAVRAMKAGAVDFIEKPILSEAIQNSIDAALAQLTPPRGHDLLVTAAVARLGRRTPREHEAWNGYSAVSRINRLPATVCLSSSANPRLLGIANFDSLASAFEAISSTRPSGHTIFGGRLG
jgi:DNA-binding response OmpR family regulator